jgi:hypothetical protein
MTYAISSSKVSRIEHYFEDSTQSHMILLIIEMSKPMYILKALSAINASKYLSYTLKYLLNKRH